MNISKLKAIIIGSKAFLEIGLDPLKPRANIAPSMLQNDLKVLDALASTLPPHSSNPDGAKRLICPSREVPVSNAIIIVAYYGGYFIFKGCGGVNGISWLKFVLLHEFLRP